MNTKVVIPKPLVFFSKIENTPLRLNLNHKIIFIHTQKKVTGCRLCVYVAKDLATR